MVRESYHLTPLCSRNRIYFYLIFFFSSLILYVRYFFVNMQNEHFAAQKRIQVERFFPRRNFSFHFIF